MLLTDMNDYAVNATDKFMKEHGQHLQKVSSPHLSSEEVAKDGQPNGKFAGSCASHVATLLFLSRVARPDISVAVQRLCRVVTRWTTTHDAMLVRLMSYLRHCGPISLVAALAPSDLEDVQLVLWSDADLCGDPEDTKSTSGLLIELENPHTGHRWPIAWSVKRQGATAGSTAEAETVAVATAVKHDGLPLASLLDLMLGGCRRPIGIEARVDNTQALAAVHRGYSKKLRYLDRTQKVSIGAIHELIESGTISAVYHETSTHRGDGFTKALVPAKFLIARSQMNMLTDNELAKDGRPPKGWDVLTDGGLAAQAAKP